MDSMKFIHQLYLVSLIFVLLATSGDINRVQADFCELPDPGVFNQKFNAWSNIAFVVAGIYMSYKTTRVTVFELLYPMIVVTMGIGSMAYHGYGSIWAGLMDYISILIYLAFIVAISVPLNGCIQVLMWVILSVVLNVAAYLTDPFVDGRPTVERTTPIVFGICIGSYALINIGTLMYRWCDKKGYRRLEKADHPLIFPVLCLVGAGVSLLVSFLIWVFSRNTQSPLCLTFPVAHGVWHIGCAITTVFLFHYHTYLFAHK